MQDEIIKSKLAFSSTAYKTAASEERYFTHLTMSKFGKEFVIAIVDRLSGQRKAHPSEFGGLCSFHDQVPVHNKYRFRRIKIYEAVDTELLKLAHHDPHKYTPSDVRGRDYTEIEDENCYEKVDSVEVSEQSSSFVFKMIIVCKNGCSQTISVETSKRKVQTDIRE